MQNIIKDFINIHDDKNSYSSGKDFEDNFRLKLKKNNIIEIQVKKGSKEEKKQKKQNVQELKKYLENLKTKETKETVIKNIFLNHFPDDTFLYQPFGTQKFPDFILFANGNIILLEFKWSENSTIAFNDSLPFFYSLYLFATPNNLFIFKGSDLITFKKYIELNKKVKEIREENKSDIREEWSIYWRPKFILPILSEKYWIQNKEKFKISFLSFLEENCLDT